MTTFEQVQALADTVLFEGYVLYPYRADDAKNRVRWQFGVLAPEALSEADASEHSALQSELLLESHPDNVAVRLRFLQVQQRTVQRSVDGVMEEVSQLDSGDTAYLPFDEAVLQEFDVCVDVSTVAETPRHELFDVPGAVTVEPVPGGQLTRKRLPVRASVEVSARALPGPYGVTRLRVVVRNLTAWGPAAPLQRQEALRSSLVAAHLLARLDRGRFLSLTDPPEWAAGYVRDCDNSGVWPVLVGAESARDMVLCSPIILPDHPAVATESTTQFFDSTEMDEMLSLRALTLTDEEKRAVRGTDPRAAELLEQVEQLPPELMDRLHGAVRYLTQRPRTQPATSAPDGDAETDGIEIDGTLVREGSKVLLRPGAKPADAQDIFVAGRTATVTKVMHDVDGRDHVAVLLDDDPGQDIARIHGRFLYFAPDEIEPLGVRT
ncbi:hypothetical protein [Flexivirga alba]|uniref:Uncharacterized protein n=1 Tax=Flexivirga alba TaxID=702742 RepID=A0ABW2AKX1_9MICO